MELTEGPPVEVFAFSTTVDPHLARAPRNAGRLTSFERMHLLSYILTPIKKHAQQVKLVSVGVFRGKLSYRELDPVSRVGMKLIWRVYHSAPEGDDRNWEAIRSWAGNLPSELFGGDVRRSTGR